MARLWVLSDLHGEFQPDDRGLVRPEDADALILAGDIHSIGSLIAYAKSIAKGLPTIIVAGNHEHYGSGMTVEDGHVRARADAMVERSLGWQVHYLENDAAVLSIGGERVQFIGATLWTDFKLFRQPEISAAAASESMGDYRAMSVAEMDCSRRPLRPKDTVRWNEASARFIRATLEAPATDKRVVVSHHGVSMRSVAARYRRDSLTPAFISDRTDLLGMGADLWVHGHTHDSFDYRQGQTRVICNPRGYPEGAGKARFENRAFNPGLVVEI